MLEYIRKLKRGLRDQHGFAPRAGSSDNEPLFDNIPDGEYPMLIDGRMDHVRIVNGAFNCCNWEG